MNMVDSIFRLFANSDDAAYFGEAVSQTEHALQTAHLAEKAVAPDMLVVAALLHDLGHLLHGLPETIAEQGVDARDGRALIEIDPRYFRPTETDALCGDPSKARQKLGWRHKATFDELVREMVESDLKEMRRDGAYRHVHD